MIISKLEINEMMKDCFKFFSNSESKSLSIFEKVKNFNNFDNKDYIDNIDNKENKKNCEWKHFLTITRSFTSLQ